VAKFIDTEERELYKWRRASLDIQTLDDFYIFHRYINTNMDCEPTHYPRER